MGTDLIKIDNVKIGEIDAIRAEVTILSSPNFDYKWWRNFKRRAKRNDYSLPKQCLVDALKAHIKGFGILHKNYEDVLVIELELCGGRAVYKTWVDIPNESVPCPCGDKTHWLIKYEYRDFRNIMNGGSVNAKEVKC